MVATHGSKNKIPLRKFCAREGSCVPSYSDFFCRLLELLIPTNFGFSTCRGLSVRFSRQQPSLLRTASQSQERRRWWLVLGVAKPLIHFLGWTWLPKRRNRHSLFPVLLLESMAAPSRVLRTPRRHRSLCKTHVVQQHQQTSFVVLPLGLSSFLLALFLVTSCQATASSKFLNAPTRRGLAFVIPQRHPIPLKYQSSVIAALRGGATTAAVNDESDGDEDAESDEEEEAAEELDGSLAASAVKSAIKTKVKEEMSKKEASKKAINAKLHQKEKTPAKAKKSASTSFFRVPYIVRALLNPVTVFKMTMAYWTSLFNLDYPKKDPVLELRSAAEEKAKSSAAGGGGGAKRGQRKMKRGQAKSLNDLPQLNTCGG